MKREALPFDPQQGDAMKIQAPPKTFFLLLLLVLLPSMVLAENEAETLILFDFEANENPESIRFDRHDNAYITMAFTGEIRKITPDLEQSTLTFLPIGVPCGDLFPPPAVLGLTFDRRDRLYVNVYACDPSNSGIYRVDTETGETVQLATAPSATALNGLEYQAGYLYAADTFFGLVWRVPVEGGILELWSDDPLLQEPPVAPGPGPNGIRYFRGKMYVAVSNTGKIVKIPLRPNGSAGTGRVHAVLPPGQGCDEFAFDVRGRIYCTTDPSNTVVRIDRNGNSETLLTAEDGIDGSTSATFGRRGRNRKNLYITNAAFPFFTTTFRPSLMRLRVDAPGARE